jgi:chromosome segregation ATPase
MSASASPSAATTASATDADADAPRPGLEPGLYEFGMKRAPLLTQMLDLSLKYPVEESSTPTEPEPYQVPADIAEGIAYHEDAVREGEEITKEYLGMKSEIERLQGVLEEAKSQLASGPAWTAKLIEEQKPLRTKLIGLTQKYVNEKKQIEDMREETKKLNEQRQEVEAHTRQLQEERKKVGDERGRTPGDAHTSTSKAAASGKCRMHAVSSRVTTTQLHLLALSLCHSCEVHKSSIHRAYQNAEQNTLMNELKDMNVSHTRTCRSR